ncbi:MAG: GSU2403 family nucleotidyltransferase fold protein [Desulfobacterales bacterium]|nr:GSU2403 family nucleotidyltransferase fold protein [Desulfobacterales bacterium]
MVCPAPRAFALHKIWMSAQPDRNPLKKQCDHNQAVAVAYLVRKYIPQHKFTSSELRMFPKSVVAAATAEILQQALPQGFE